MRRAIAATALVLPVLVGGLGSAPSAAVGDPARPVLRAGPGQLDRLGVQGQRGVHRLFGVAAIGADNAFAVGQGGSALAVRARHWDGQQWLPTHPPGGRYSALLSVAAISPTNVWGVGVDEGEALANHWDGTGWTRVPTPPPGQGDADHLTAVDGIATDDVWAVGYSRLDFGGNDTKPLIEHWDGATWTEVPYTLPYGNTLGHLRGVTVISATDAWAVGSTYGERNVPLLLHWNGNSWDPATDILSSSSSTGIDRISVLNAVDAVATDDVWAVGAGDAVLLHWDGRAWTRLRSPIGTRDWLINGLYGVAAVGTDDVWAVGGYGDDTTQDFTRIMHWDGQRWKRVRSPDPGRKDNVLWAVSATGPDDAWAVGSLANNNRTSLHLYLHWDGDTWTRVRTGDHPDPSLQRTG